MAIGALTPVARIRSEFPAKFGIPRQSGSVPQLRSQVVFEPEFRNPDVVRGIEGFSHLWLIWQFSTRAGQRWRPTVRPPRLGGERVGVFATRSPLRPNPLGLSSVELVSAQGRPGLGIVLTVAGADLMDGTPIVDIKPYVPGDCHPDARHGFVDSTEREALTVEDPAGSLASFSPREREAVRAVLAQDPRPAFHDDPGRVYGMTFAGADVRFTVADAVLCVVEVTKPPGRGGDFGGRRESALA